MALVFLWLAATTAAGIDVSPLPPLSAPLTPVGAAAVVPQIKIDLAGVTSLEPAAAARIEVAREVLGPSALERLDALGGEEQTAALQKIWDGWEAKGLAEDAAGAGDLAKLDAAVVAGVDDKALTHANKSIFLGVGVLGYPLADALWLARTRIRDALDDNTLHYPPHQRWKTTDGTPEFLGRSPTAQPLVDAWGAATDTGRHIVAQVRAGSTDLPDSKIVAQPAAAAFARVAEELHAAGDEAALRYLSGEDPTFSAFLLDVQKPGYYLYNADHAIVGRIMATRAFQALGIRRVDHHVDAGFPPHVYLYRPPRLVERLAAAGRESPGDDHSDAPARLSDYARRLAPLARRPLPVTEAQSRYRFAPAETLSGSTLDSPGNRVDVRKLPEVSGNWDLPLPLGSLRGRLQRGEPHASFSDSRWAGLRRLIDATPALRAASDDVVVRFVSQPWRTRGLLITKAPGARSEVWIQMSVLEELARQKAPGSDIERFATTAVTAALAP